LYIWTDWNLIREPLGTAALRREQCQQWERSRRRKIEPQEDETKCSPWKKKRWYTCRLFETNSLKEGAM
jgi:hypothetical protein